MNLHEELAAKDSLITTQSARIAELEAQLAAASPSGTDKLREAIEALDELADEAEANGNTSAWTNSMVAKVRSAMEAQAPVREVPDTRPGIEAVVALIQKQCDDYHREHGSQEPDTGVWNYPGDGNEWMCDREELLDEIRALLPAAPVQQEG